MLESLKKDIESYAKKAVLFLDKYFEVDEFEFDHISYQTSSSKDYEKVLKKFKKSIDIIIEIPHAGRRITIAELREPFSVNGFDINRIEISEPKPKKSVVEKKLDHIAFVVPYDFEEFIDELGMKGLKVSEVKQIGEDKIAKVPNNGIEMEFRNKMLGEKGVPEKKELKRKEKKDNDEDLENLRNKLKDEREKKLRALADYQNLTKRLEKEREEIADMTNITIIGELLDLIDDFDRVLKNLSIEEKDQVGLRMLREKIQKMIDRYGLEEILCSDGDKMDPEMYEAVGVVAVDDDKQNNTVKEVVQKGYKIKHSGKIVRPVKVIISKNTK